LPNAHHIRWSSLGAYRSLQQSPTAFSATVKFDELDIVVFSFPLGIGRRWRVTFAMGRIEVKAIGELMLAEKMPSAEFAVCVDAPRKPNAAQNTGNYDCAHK
jgi:hypothetical protein